MWRGVTRAGVTTLPQAQPHPHPDSHGPGGRRGGGGAGAGHAASAHAAALPTAVPAGAEGEAGEAFVAACSEAH